MKSTPLLLSALLVWIICSGVLPAADPGLIRQELEYLLKQRRELKERAREEMAAMFEKAAESRGAAMNLYEEAIKETLFAGRSGQLQDMVEWRRKNDAWLKSQEFDAALRLHLKYLALTIKRAGSDQPDQFVAPSTKYLEELLAADKRFFAAQDKAPKEQTDLLSAPLTNSPIVRQRQLAPFLTGVAGKEWEMVPGNVEGILNNNIRRVLREAGNPMLLETWDYQVRYEQERSTADRLRLTTAEFENLRLPTLNALKAEDMIQLGQQQEALEIYLKLIRNYANHPSFEAWVDKALGLLPPESGSAAGATEPSN